MPPTSRWLRIVSGERVDFMAWGLQVPFWDFARRCRGRDALRYECQMTRCGH